jgi:glycosyltransferase involved in cell wall biosynthesis
MVKTLPTILLAAMALDLGGAETHVISLARELRRQGHKVIVASAGGRMVSMLQEAGIPHVLVPMGSRNPVDLLRAYRRLLALLTDSNIGLIHAHARIPAWLASLAVKRRPTPLVTTYHGVYNAGFPWKYLTAFGQRTIAVSDDVRRHLEGPLGCPPGQIRVVPNGFDTDLFRPGLDPSPILKEFGVPAGRRHVVHAGRLDDQFADAFLALLKALPDIDREVPGTHLWILGDGNRADEVRRQAAETNRQMGRGAATVAGFRLDVPTFFNLADVVVAVARTATEAMSCGRPVVIAGEGGYRGILTADKLDEYAGANFTARVGGRPLNPAEIAGDIIRLLQPEAAAERAQMGEAGRQYVMDHYSIAAVTTKVIDVYAEVL